MAAEHENQPFLRHATRLPSRRKLSTIWAATVSSCRMPSSGTLLTSLLTAPITSLLLATVLKYVDHAKHHDDDIRMSHYDHQDSHNYHHRSIFRYSRDLYCGSSAIGARDMGCQYDILSNHWVPAQCMDKGAVTEYQTDGTWLGFGDANQRQPHDAVDD